MLYNPNDTLANHPAYISISEYCMDYNTLCRCRQTEQHCSFRHRLLVCSDMVIMMIQHISLDTTNTWSWSAGEQQHIHTKNTHKHIRTLSYANAMMHDMNTYYIQWRAGENTSRHTRRVGHIEHRIPHANGKQPHRARPTVCRCKLPIPETCKHINTQSAMQHRQIHPSMQTNVVVHCRTHCADLVWISKTAVSSSCRSSLTPACNWCHRIMNDVSLYLNAYWADNGIRSEISTNIVLTTTRSIIFSRKSVQSWMRISIFRKVAFFVLHLWAQQ